MKLVGYKKIEGIIEVVTGLHIGGSSSTIEIGGRDNPVIRNPISKEPYIPGSSLKGKMRSLLELRLGKIEGDPASKFYGEVHSWCNDSSCPICTIFGTSGEEGDIGPTRLIVRDAFLDTEFKRNLESRGIGWSPIAITEDKFENSINRITARANPRNFERVVAGAIFAFNMNYRVFSNGDNGVSDEQMFPYVLDALRLIEDDALGGAGSRGCGQVKFTIQLHDYTLKSLNEIRSTDFPTTVVEIAHEC